MYSEIWVGRKPDTNEYAVLAAIPKDMKLPEHFKPYKPVDQNRIEWKSNLVKEDEVEDLITLLVKELRTSRKQFIIHFDITNIDES